MTVKLIPHRPDSIIGLEIDGWIDAEDIQHVIELIEQRIDTKEKLKIYAEVNNWSGMSLEAFIKDLRFGLQHLNDFDKEAIVSDSRWLQGLAAVGNTLFSGLEIKHFTFDEQEKALEWIMS